MTDTHDNLSLELVETAEAVEALGDGVEVTPSWPHLTQLSVRGDDALKQPALGQLQQGSELPQLRLDPRESPQLHGLVS